MVGLLVYDTVMTSMLGQSFGRLTVIASAPNALGSAYLRWLCSCSCGNEKIVPGYVLRSGGSRSCGCLARESSRSTIKLAQASCKTHGLSASPEYNSYLNAQSRCENKGNAGYLNYGGRGIEFRFRSFEEFIAEVGPRPAPKKSYSLDRIDNDGHYEPGNVRWATRKEQNANRRCQCANCPLPSGHASRL